MKTTQDRVIEELLQEIASGRHGSFGAPFLTTRELAAYKKISLKTAFAVLIRLRELGVLEKSGRRNLLHNAVPVQASSPGKRLLIGLVVTSLESPYFAKLAKYAEEFAHSIGAGLLIASSNYDFSVERERLEMFCQQGAAGLLICPWANGEEELFYRTLPVPAVMIGRRLERLRADTVLVNNQLAAQNVAVHLAEEGYREFAYIGQEGTPHDPRLSGFRFGLMESGFSLPQENIIRLHYGDRESLDAGIVDLLERRHGPLGLFCYHDLFASAAVSACLRRGVRIPEELGIAGFDDLPIAAELYPPLTSVRYPLKDMARIACETLFARINLGMGKAGDGVYRTLDTELIVRESTRYSAKE